MGKAVTVKWLIASVVNQLPGKAEANPGRTLFIPKLRNNRELFLHWEHFFFLRKDKFP